jgi:PncC family amidohydrolase
MSAADNAPASTRQPHLARSAALGQALRARGWSCATAESCTGGGIAHAITAIAGSSDYFLGGIVAYSNPAKVQLLGVRQRTLDSVGAVSAECAAEMARGARHALGTDVGVSSTGIAGPGGATARKPVGLVYIAVSTPESNDVRELRLAGDRLAVIEQAIASAFDLALEHLQRGAGTPETETTQP